MVLSWLIDCQNVGQLPVVRQLDEVLLQLTGCVAKDIRPSATPAWRIATRHHWLQRLKHLKIGLPVFSNQILSS